MFVRYTSMAIYSPDEWRPLLIILQIIANQVDEKGGDEEVVLVLCDLDEPTLYLGESTRNGFEYERFLLFHGLCTVHDEIVKGRNSVL